MRNAIRIFLFIALFALSVNIVSANIEVEGISFNPAIIAAGDEVDITVNFREMITSGSSADIKANKPEYTLNVILEPSDTISERYITLLDADGDSNIGHLFSVGVWRKTFRVKVNNDAIPGNYELKLNFQYVKNGVPENAFLVHKFIMPVKHEGIVLGIANIVTNPSAIRPGDDFVEITTYIENSGSKSAKSIEAKLSVPDKLEHSYSDNNRKWIGMLSPNESKQISFFVNIDENADSKKYDIDLTLDYSDIDNNKYTKKASIPLLVKERPNIEVVDVKGIGLAGSRITLEVMLKNVGTEDAEAVDARIIKQSSQPFSFDLRSNYIGELQVGDTGKAVFEVNIGKEAEQKEHNLKLLIRAKGDSDKGDNNIYIFNRGAIIDVNGKKVNPVVGMVIGVQSNGSNRAIGIGVILSIVIFGLAIYKKFKRKK